MRLHRNLRLALCVTTIAAAMTAHADVQQDLSNLGHRWAAINYQTPANQQGAAFEKLAESAQQIAAQFPARAEPIIWEAIALSGEAKAEGGLGALNKVKQARQLLLDAEKIDANAMDGSIYSSLGSLYAKVPGWPIGYGDRKKAVEYFDKALAIAPDNIDTHFFYADLLADQGDYAGAAAHLKKALGAPARPDRADADMGRRQEAQQLLDSLKQKHGAQLAGV
ncbi:MAG TPA: tetratricopeptide repeat protein [Spongiibacteraceae bacterium]|nr:tetratricopeptide repeat protein [Spongiibacteraceae bacterium]